MRSGCWSRAAQRSMRATIAARRRMTWRSAAGTGRRRNCCGGASLALASRLLVPLVTQRDPCRARRAGRTELLVRCGSRIKSAAGPGKEVLPEHAERLVALVEEIVDLQRKLPARRRNVASPEVRDCVRRQRSVHVAVVFVAARILAIEPVPAETNRKSIACVPIELQLEILPRDTGQPGTARDVDVAARVGGRVCRTVQPERGQVCGANATVGGLRAEGSERCARREVHALAKRASHVLEEARVEHATRGDELDVVV